MKLMIFVLFILLSSLSWAEKFGVNSGGFSFQATEILECKSLEESVQYNHYASKCFEFFENSAKQRLEAEYLNLLSTFTRDSSDLKDAQSKWREFSVAQCKLEDSLANSKSGTDAELDWNNKVCMYNQYLQRTKYLKSVSAECPGCIK